MDAALILRSVRAALRTLAAFPLEEVRKRSWRSENFRGSRYEFALRFDGPKAGSAADSFIQQLRPSVLETPEHIVADVSLVSDERRPGWARLRIEVLTVEA